MKFGKNIKKIFLSMVSIIGAAAPISFSLSSCSNKTKDQSEKFTEYKTLTFETSSEYTLEGAISVKIKTGKTFGTITPPKALKPDCIFKNWSYTNPETGTTEIMDNNTIIKENLLLTPNFVPDTTKCTITFNGGTGDVAFTSIEVTPGIQFSKIKKPEASKTGANFVGWYDSSSNHILDNTIVCDDLTVTAKYTNDSSFSGNEYVLLTFKPDDDYTTFTGNTKVAIKKNTTFNTINTPKYYKGNFKFKSWQNATGELISDSSTFTENTIIYPFFEQHPFINSDKIYCYFYDQKQYGVLESCPATTTGDITFRLESGVSYSIPKSTFNEEIFFGTKMTAIPDNFLYGCSNFNQEIFINSKMQTIGKNFLYGCTSFNHDLTIPSTVTSVGQYFLKGCDNISSILTINIPASRFSDTTSTFLSASSSSAAAYKEGIGIKGVYASNIITNFPMSTSYYRNIYNATSDGGSVTVGSIKYHFDFASSGICSSNSSTAITIPGLSSIARSSFNYAITISPSTKTIPEYFLAYCTSFSQNLTIPSTVTKVGDGFMYNTMTTTYTYSSSYYAYYKNTGFGAYYVPSSYYSSSSQTIAFASLSGPILTINCPISAFPSSSNTILCSNSYPYTYGIYRSRSSTKYYYCWTCVKIAGTTASAFCSRFSNIAKSSTTYYQNQYYRYLRYN